MNYEDNPHSIKYYVKQYLLRERALITRSTVVDFPAGNGVTSRIARDLGARVVPLDLFPEYFSVAGLECRRANIANGLPVDGGSADLLICQEGIEHFPDQIKAFKEFNRVLKRGGTLLVTTPNYSNLRAKLSYLFAESERFGSLMPPNEIDSVWVSEQDITEEPYYGHLFLLGIQKLRVFGRLSGFRIKRVHSTRVKSTSLILLPFIYPLVILFNGLAYRKSLRKSKGGDSAATKRVYREILKLALNPRILIDSHLMVEYEKEVELDEVGRSLKSKHAGFGLT